MIGVFDSGVGGLTIVREIFRYLPEYQIIYFGDTARLPYGTKGERFVKEYSEKIVKWLLDRGAKIIVIACHTSSAWAADSLKRKLKKVPIFEMITPVVREVVKETENNPGQGGGVAAGRSQRIGIIGTPGTIKSNAYEKKLSAEDGLAQLPQVYSVACPLFVPLVEEGWINHQETEEIARKYLKPLKNKIDTLILGCTHYPLLKNLIKKIMGPKVKIINPAESLARELKLFLKNNPRIDSELKRIKRGDSHKFFFSDEPYNLKTISKLCLDREIEAEVKDPF